MSRGPTGRCMGAVLVGALALCAECFGQGTMRVGFEGPAYPGAPQPQPRGTYVTISQYSESGMRFWNPYGLENLTLMGGGLSGEADNGTAYLNAAGGARVGFGLISGQYFDLLAIDAAESQTGPVTLQFVGYHTMGRTVTNYFTLDGVNDGTGPLQDFQTFYPDSEFLQVYRVDVLTDRWSLDNLVIGGVPEPSAGALMLLGAAFAMGQSRRRRKNI